MTSKSAAGVECLPKVPPFSYRRFATRAAPLALFERLYGGDPIAFLYESLESRGVRGRYSFVGGRPHWTLRAQGMSSRLTCGGRTQRIDGNPLETLRSLVRAHPEVPPVAPFCGGAVGYLSYDSVRWIERIPSKSINEPEIADAFFLFPREVICFDHLEKVVHVLVYSEDGREKRLRDIAAALASLEPSSHSEEPAAAPAASAAFPPPGLIANMTREQFCAMVLRAKEHINAGDIFQVVLSQRFEFSLSDVPPDGLATPTPETARALAVYRALRTTNPSPYMYFLRLEDLHIAGSSPEMLVRSYGRRVTTKPLAGTRRRGETPEEDALLETQLRADPKERAEHVMLVDLGRNDLGRVCEYGSVHATGIMDIERHSRVMHLVSTVEGWLADGRDAIDVFSAAFPAGTVSGAPKVRAMEIIDELEPTRRGVYAGAIGYFSLLGDVDLCIAIRSIVMKGEKGYIQAGAGIVADSSPEAEYEETLNKAAALFRAVAAVRGQA
ncbi:MAG: anthranilate synthase component I [Planctomycetes bacterium]|nr:anthranilate synthase component I [Planctomycetota bacterium]